MRCINDFEVGSRLQKLRESKGNNKTDLSIELNISTAQYGRLESGKSRITIEVLNKVCSYYNTSIDYVLFGEGSLHESVFFEKIRNYSEIDIRRFLKILSCLFSIKDGKKYSGEPYYKIFMDGLLEMIPVSAASSIMYVLEYERIRRKVSENQMIDELGLSRFKWNSIMSGKRVHDISIPLQISNKYGYDMNFLINNRLSSDMFFDKLFAEESIKRQKSIMEIFDFIVKEKD